MIFKYHLNDRAPDPIKKGIASYLVVFAVVVGAGIFIQQIRQPAVSFTIDTDVESNQSISPGYDVHIVGKIDGLMASRVEDQEAAINRSLLVEINSTGGRVDAGIRIADIIRATPHGAICTVTGEASSMAFIILQACRVRRAVPGTTVMTHRTSTYITKSVMSPAKMRKTADDDDEEWNEMRENVALWVSQRGFRSQEEVSSRLQHMTEFHDWEMTGEEAHDEGFLDTPLPAAWKPVDYEEETS